MPGRAHYLALLLIKGACGRTPYSWGRETGGEMRLRMLFIGAIAGTAIAILLFLVRGTQTVDIDLHMERLGLLQQIGNLDDRLDRAVVLETTSALVASRKTRTELTAEVGDKLDALEEGRLAFRGLSPGVDAALDQFQEKIGDKFGLAWDFESQTSRGMERMIRSVDSVPFYIGKLEKLSDDQALHQILRSLQYAITTYAISPRPSDIVTGAVEQRSKELEEIEGNFGTEFQDASKRLRGAVNDVIVDKTDLVNLLNDFLTIPTVTSLQGVEEAYNDYHESRVAVANQYRIWLAAYTAILLLMLALLGLRLAKSFRDLDRANETLEEQVKERTADLSQALKNLKESQAQLIQSEKMASLGQMVAGVAHEINTPLGYARSNSSIIRGAIRDIRGVCEAQKQAIELLGSPDATDQQIAEALENAARVEDQIQSLELADELDNLLNHSEFGLTHIGELVQSLKDFSRVDRTRTDLFDLNQGVESTLKLATNHLKKGIEVVKKLDRLPEIECSPSQINQVLLNLVTNAAQAIGDKPDGRITIHTNALNNGVGIRVIDNGSGMTPEVLEQIFDPFFTTKDVGGGTGLGLSISYKIIQDHHGRITAKSTPGVGSEFIIWLPSKQPESEDGMEPIATEALAAATA